MSNYDLMVFIISVLYLNRSPTASSKKWIISFPYMIVMIKNMDKKMYSILIRNVGRE